MLTTVPDTVNPDAPVITFTSNGVSGSSAPWSGIVLSWSPTVHNGTYYLDKMNGTGNWVGIYRIKTNDNVTVDLAATELGSNVLPKETEDGDAPVYHRFRVVAENSSGLFSLTDKVLILLITRFASMALAPCEILSLEEICQLTEIVGSKDVAWR